MWNIGAFGIGGQVSYGINEGLSNWYSGYNSFNSVAAYSQDRTGKNVYDAETIQAMIVPSLKFTDTLRFEAGLGYRMDQANDARATPRRTGPGSATCRL